jgi:hypothetical protein
VRGAEKRSLIQFNLDVLPAGATVHSATLGIRNAWNACGEQEDGIGSSQSSTGEEPACPEETVSIYSVTEPWMEETPTWTTFADKYAPEVWGTLDQDGWGVAGITDLVTAWVSDTLPNYGLMLISAPALSGDRYISSDHYLVGKRPWLEVCYTED